MLEVHGLRKRYGQVVALDGCSFRVRPGRLTGFLGPNGAGKTTTMRAVLGLVHPDRGTVAWRGAPVDAGSRRRFGYMPEERGLYPKMRVGDQLAYFGHLSGLGRREARRAADRWLDELGLGGRARAHVDELSHGNQQRTQLAVALVHDPELLLLDEPFAGLDPLAVDSLVALLRRLTAAGRTVLFSSHQLDLVEDLCEDVVIVDHGRVVLDGELAELRGRARGRVLEIEVETGGPGWPPRVPGAEILQARDGHARLLVERGTDLPTLAAVAAAAGTVRRFDLGPPRLSDLFREAVRR